MGSYLSVAINSRGYTDELYETCGDQTCVAAVLAAVGVNVAGRDPGSIDREDPIGDGVSTVSVLPSGETDYDVWCAACGEFLHHGLECSHPDGQDCPPAAGPHINLRNAPSIRALWT